MRRSVDELSGPFPDPLYLFSTEVWNLVFEKLEDPNDLLNVAHSTDCWYRMIQPKRTSFLFSPVLNILGNRGLLFPTRDRSPIVSCRLVCKVWNHAVQDYLQLHPSHFSVSNDARDLAFPVNRDFTNLLREERLKTDFCHRARVDKFMRKFEACPPTFNPFPTRAVAIADTGIDPFRRQALVQLKENLQLFFDSVTPLLERFGKEIFHLKIDIQKEPDTSQFYSLLQTWLSLTPNVKTLHLTHVYRYQEYSRVLLHLEENIEIAPLPRLNHLSFVKTSCFSREITRHLLQNNDHIEKLANVCLGGVRPLEYDTCFRQITLRNLTEWFVKLTYKEEVTKLISVLTEVHWPLKILHINFLYVETNAKEWNPLFQFVDDCFGETLVDLRISLPRICLSLLEFTGKFLVFKQCHELRLNLPHLKQLRMDIPSSCSIDFLMPLGDSLEILQIDQSDWHYASKSTTFKAKIKFNGVMAEKMEKSNIWEVLPKLRKLGLKTRKGKNYLYKKVKGGVCKQIR